MGRRLTVTLAASMAGSLETCRIPLLYGVLAVSLAACGGNDDSASGPGSSPGEQGGLTISMATTDFGSALVDLEGKVALHVRARPAGKRHAHVTTIARRRGLLKVKSTPVKVSTRGCSEPSNVRTGRNSRCTTMLRLLG